LKKKLNNEKETINLRKGGAGTPYRSGGDIAWQVPSDERLKNITGNFNHGLKEICALEVKTFNYKSNNELQLNPEKEYSGVIAQEVQKVIPEAVEEHKGYLTLQTTPIFWAMIKSIQEQQKIIESQNDIIIDLAKRVRELEKKGISYKE